jgi:hypothetical protein
MDFAWEQSHGDSANSGFVNHVADAAYFGV